MIYLQIIKKIISFLFLIYSLYLRPKRIIENEHTQMKIFFKIYLIIIHPPNGTS